MQELDLWLFSQPPSLRAQAWMSLHHAIPKPGWTKWQWIRPLSPLRLTGHPPFLHARVPGDTQLCKGDPKEHHSLPWDLHLDLRMPGSQDATLIKAADLRSLPMKHSTEPSGDLGTPRLWHSWLERLWGTLTVMWIWSGIPAVYLPVLIPRDPSKVSDVVQSLSSVRLFATSWTAALQASLAFTPRVCSDSCPLNQWCHATISSFVAPFSPCTQIFPSIRVFSNGSALRIRWPKHWSFSTSPSNKYSGLISFRIDWLDLPCCPRDSQESSAASQFENINSLVLNLLYGSTLTSIHDYWKTHSFDYMDFGQQSDVSAF